MAFQEEIRLHECEALPKGWKRQEVLRRNGLTSGKSDIYYISPSGKKFRSKPQLARYLGDSVDLSTFDYRTGKINPMLERKCKKTKGTLFDYSRGIHNDASLVPPIRQTASIFKQPVTVVKTQRGGRTKEDLKQISSDKPKQVFWEKRLQGLQAFDVQTEVIRTVELPRVLKGIGPNVEDQTVLQIVGTAFFMLTRSQRLKAQKPKFNERNEAVFLELTEMMLCDISLKRIKFNAKDDGKKAYKLLCNKFLGDLEA
ncbi:unnamed protein product, partial [Meganyctiphanes norvegica]